MIETLPFNIVSIHAAYATEIEPGDVVDEVFRRMETVADPGIFLSVRGRAEIERDIQALGPRDLVEKPLWGIPFCVKDNIDVAGMHTTAACPAYAYAAAEDAFCIRLLKEAGALLIGKTNLDQFATGLVGVRTPFPVPRNAVDANLVPGGSSSGSAVAVAHGMVAFSLGTDTAGSGRVPAALNNIVGLKPTLGALSATGVVPACKTLDTISVFALNVDDAYRVASLAAQYDETDAFSRAISFPAMKSRAPLRVGVPSRDSRRFFGDELQSNAFSDALELLEDCGVDIVETDFQAFYEVAELLYSGTWVAERYTVVADLLQRAPEAVHATTRSVITTATKFSAADAFLDHYRLADYKRRLAPVISGVDLLCVPTIPTIVRMHEIERDPIVPNSRLGTYTNFVNLLDLCGIAVPVRSREDGLPGSITLLAPAGKDAQAAALGRDVHIRSGVRAGATGWSIPAAEPDDGLASSEEIEIAVVGAHMSGLPLNGELTRLGGRFLRAARTAASYKLFALAGGPPKRPGLVRDCEGQSIELETWALPRTRFGDFMAGVPHPLGIGTITLDTTDQVKGFICEPVAIHGATEITHYGGWRNYLGALGSASI